MPGHVRAADAPEDLWRCQECGWTYPNHHPSAKHRRNHKKQCGRISGLTGTKDFTTDAQVVNGSSDDASSDEEHHRSSSEGLQKIGYDQEQPKSPTRQAGSSKVEQICDDRINLLSSKDGVANLSPSIHEETAISTGKLNLSHSKNSAEMHHGNDLGRGGVRSAHASKGQWTCRHCGWAYPNAHPSAKNRRKHKKNCGIGAQHAEPGGSSDEASSDDGIESNMFSGSTEPLNGDSSASRGAPGPETINGVSSKDTDLFKEVEVGATADIAQVSPDSDSSNSLVLRGTTRMDGIVGGKDGGKGEEKLESDESQVTMVDEGNIKRPTHEQVSGAPDRAISVPPIETINSKQSQILGEFMHRAVPNGVKPIDLDWTVVHQLPLHATSEQVDCNNPHPEPSPGIFSREDGDRSINGLEQGYSEAAQSQSPVMIGKGSQKATVESPELGTKTPQTKFALQASARGESLNVEERSSPGSPEGLVRSRVQIFEKLAGTSPQYLRKSVSPKTNSASPGSHVSSRLQNGTPETNIRESDSRKDLRHQQFSERMAQPVFDAPSELQKAMSHVLHRGNFV